MEGNFKIMSNNIAVILFNIGGPENLSQVKQYLFNFFSDKFIITAPWIMRKFLAFLISRTRCKKTTGIYELIGGKSFAVENTMSQSNALESLLNNSSEDLNFKTYIAMSYWGPSHEDVARNINEDNKTMNFKHIILLPLYPQYSTTTSLSSKYYFEKALSKVNKELLNKCRFIESYYDNDYYIEAHVDLISKVLALMQPEKTYKLIFSAHSIPVKLVKKGDPYQKHVIETVKLIIDKIQKIDYMISYQSKVGPIKWLEPSTEDEVLKCAQNKIIPIIVPITFVSENSETLYELDIEYRDLLKENGIDECLRVPTLSLHPKFLECLKEKVYSKIFN